VAHSDGESRDDIEGKDASELLRLQTIFFHLQLQMRSNGM